MSGDALKAVLLIVVSGLFYNLSYDSSNYHKKMPEVNYTTTSTAPTSRPVKSKSKLELEDELVERFLHLK